MANGNVQIQSVGGGTTYATIASSGTGFTFLTAIYKYANLTLAYSPNDPGLQFTYVNSSLAPSVFLQARFFNLLNEPSQGVSINVGTTAFPGISGSSDCIDVRSTGAVGDGVKDDTAAIQKALDMAAVNASGKTTQVSKGLRVLQSATADVSTANANSFSNGGRNLVIPLNKTTTQNSLLVVFFDAFNWGTVPTVSDTAGNTYVQFAAVADGQHVTYGYWALNRAGGTVSVSAVMTGGHSNSFLIGAFVEMQSPTLPIAIDGTVGTAFVGPGASSLTTSTQTLTNALDTVFSFIYTGGSSAPATVAPGGFTSVTKTNFSAASGIQEIVLVRQDLALSGASQSLNAQWGLDGNESGAIGFTVAFKAQPLTQTVAFTGPTTVCIPFGVNCLVSYSSIDACDGIWYSNGRRCLTMDTGVSLRIDGSIIKAKEDLFATTLYIDPPDTIDFSGRLFDILRTVTLVGFNAAGTPTTETFQIGGSNSTYTTATTWSAITDASTVTPPMSWPFGPDDSQEPYLSYGTNTGDSGFLDIAVVNGHLKFGNQLWEITKASNLQISPPSQLYVYSPFGSPTSGAFSATIVLTGKDASGADVTDTIVINNQTSGTSNLTFSQVYSGTAQFTAPSLGSQGLQLFYYPPFTQSNAYLNLIGYFGIMVPTGPHTVQSKFFKLGQFPGSGWVIENLNAFSPYGQFNDSRFSSPGVFYKSPTFSDDYNVDLLAAHSLEGFRNANISIYGTGQVILNGDWAYRNADQNLGVFAIGAFISHVGFVRVCACDNFTIEGLEIISPSRSAISVLHSDAPTIQNVYIHDGHGDDLGLGIPYDSFQIELVDGVINLDWCRNARVTLNRLYNNEWGGIADWSSYQSLIQQNDMNGGRYGYQFVSVTMEFFIDFFETGLDVSGIIPVNNEISGNRATNMTQPSPPPNNRSPTTTYSTGFGWGFGFFDDGGPGQFFNNTFSSGASGISFHDNVANNNVTDFIAKYDIAFRSLYNNSFGSGAPGQIVNGQTQVSNETPSGAIDGVNKIFTLAHTPSAGTLNLTLNGLLQTDGTDYTLSGNTITFTTAPPLNNTMLASYTYQV